MNFSKNLISKWTYIYQVSQYWIINIVTNWSWQKKDNLYDFGLYCVVSVFYKPTFSEPKLSTLQSSWKKVLGKHFKLFDLFNSKGKFLSKSNTLDGSGNFLNKIFVFILFFLLSLSQTKDVIQVIFFSVKIRNSILSNKVFWPNCFLSRFLPNSDQIRGCK